jgi:hypothetical protein
MAAAIPAANTVHLDLMFPPLIDLSFGGQILSVPLNARILRRRAHEINDRAQGFLTDLKSRTALVHCWA